MKVPRRHGDARGVHRHRDVHQGPVRERGDQRLARAPRRVARTPRHRPPQQLLLLGQLRGLVTGQRPDQRLHRRPEQGDARGRELDPDPDVRARRLVRIIRRCSRCFGEFLEPERERLGGFDRRSIDVHRVVQNGIVRNGIVRRVDEYVLVAGLDARVPIRSASPERRRDERRGHAPRRLGRRRRTSPGRRRTGQFVVQRRALRTRRSKNLRTPDVEVHRAKIASSVDAICAEGPRAGDEPGDGGAQNLARGARAISAIVGGVRISFRFVSFRFVVDNLERDGSNPDRRLRLRRLRLRRRLGARLDVEHGVEFGPVVLAHVRVVAGGPLVGFRVGRFERGPSLSGKAKDAEKTPGDAPTDLVLLDVADQTPAPGLLVRDRAEEHADVRRVPRLHGVHRRHGSDVHRRGPTPRRARRRLLGAALRFPPLMGTPRVRSDCVLNVRLDVLAPRAHRPHHLVDAKRRRPTSPRESLLADT
mmetsp:Transcript_2666/g.9942  ORF Transcript_2666/g.9942 Transcript_2666/m.9942 type:complete len:476 (+) Transcript_2666:101-1528(+)